MIGCFEELIEDVQSQGYLPQEEGASELVGDDAEDETTEPTNEPVLAAPVSACREEAQGSQLEPENTSAALPQGADQSKGSVEGWPSAPDRQNGVFSPAPARENALSGASAAEEGDDPSAGAGPTPEWAAAVTLSACRGADFLLNDDPLESAEGSAQAIDDQKTPAGAVMSA